MRGHGVGARAAPCLCAALLVAARALGAPASYCDEVGWTREWAEEFDTLDAGSWTVANGTCENDSSCRDAMCLTSNVAVRGGQLVLTARREEVGWAHYSTGAVESRNKKSFAAAADHPVRVCVAGTLPGDVRTGRGLWPAFWMM